MGYDRGGSFPFDFEINGIPFGSKSKGKLPTERKSVLSILNQMEFYLVQNRKENCHYDHIPFNVKGNGNIVFSMNCAITGISSGNGGK